MGGFDNEGERSTAPKGNSPADDAAAPVASETGEDLDADDDLVDDDLEDLDDDEDADDSDDDDSDEDDSDEDELEDATDDEIDFVVSAHREDGQLLVQAQAKDLANDLEELITQLRRLPGDAGALGFVSLVEEVFVLVRVRGQHVQVLLSDSSAASDWPLAHDVADFLGLEVFDDDDDDDVEPMGDVALLADLGVSAFDIEALIDNFDLGSDQMLIEIADKINLNPQFQTVVDSVFTTA